MCYNNHALEFIQRHLAIARHPGHITVLPPLRNAKRPACFAYLMLKMTVVSSCFLQKQPPKNEPHQKGEKCQAWMASPQLNRIPALKKCLAAARPVATPTPSSAAFPPAASAAEKLVDFERTDQGFRLQVGVGGVPMDESIHQFCRVGYNIFNPGCDHPHK